MGENVFVSAERCVAILRGRSHPSAASRLSGRSGHACRL